MENRTAATTTLVVTIDIPESPATVFTWLIEELKTSLGQAGMTFEPGENGRLIQSGFEVGRVVAWIPGELVRIEWRPASWKPDVLTEVQLKLEPLSDGATRATLEQPGWGSLIEMPDELTGWFSSQVVTPLLYAASPVGGGIWLTDRRARRPSGAQSRSIYRDPLYHYPNFYVLLELLSLSSDDYLVEVGCGGGAFLNMALQSGCRAAAIDHSLEMVQLAREVNQEAVRADRLEIQLAGATSLPFPDGAFTAAVMTGVLGFLAEPVSALEELRRVLATGGRLAVLGSDIKLKGTPAAPEPMASYLHFYSDDEFRQLALDAGFEQVEVVRRDLEPFARLAGVPEEALPLFAGEGTPFMVARKG
jgi:SAM-dependent methyltransferase